MKHKLIFEAIVGSQAYGLATENSDVDKKGVYMQSIDDLITFDYEPQINVTKDECYYEVQRFLELLKNSNPTMLELLFSDNEFILKSSPQFELIRNNRDKFLTKKCAKSFENYAHSQILKASGLNKKINLEKEKVTRKTPLDFCYIAVGGKTMPLAKWLEINGFKQEFCGLVNLDHFKDCYAVYYDNSEEIHFKGIVKESSNELRLSSIPKGMFPVATMSYNKDGYTMSCRQYKEYCDWLKNRNVNRYVDVKNHGQTIDNQMVDGKNLLHCRRILDLGLEIFKNNTLTIKCPNRDYLLSIKRGEVSLEEIIKQAELDIAELKELYDKSNLPDEVDPIFVKKLLLEIRKM